MKNPLRRIITSPVTTVFLLMLAAIGGGIIFFRLGDTPPRRTDPHAQIIATADVSAEGQPVLLFAAIDPSVSEVLLNRDPISLPDAAPVNIEDIPPLGTYLPSSSEEGYVFELRPDLRLSPLDNELVDNYAEVESNAVGTVDLLDYAGDGCAPGGLPVSGVLTQRYHRLHAGIDIGAPLGTPALATHSGEVVFAGWNTNGYGYLVIVENGPFITYYAHLTNFNVKSGDKIGAGSVIAWTGSTGNSTGPHVHYETRINDVPVDPLTFEQRGFSTC